METKSFRWLLEVLAHEHVNLPVLDTFLVSKSQVSSWIITDSKGKLHKKPMDSATYTLSTIDLISSEYFEAIKLRQRGSDIAYVYTREGRIVVSQNTLEDFKMRNLYGVTVFCIQRAKPHLGENSKLYRLKLEYSKNEYSAEFYLINPLLKVKNREWFQEVKDIATTILAAILESTEKVIISIDIDFMKDERNQFWVAYVWNCKLVPWDIFKEENYDFKSTYIRMDSKIDLGNKLKRRDDSLNKFGNKKKKLYQFRVRTPEDSVSSEDDEYEHGWLNLKKNSKIKLLGSALLNGVLAVEPNLESRDSRKRFAMGGNSVGGTLSDRSLKHKSSQNVDSTYEINPHFLELLCKTRGKINSIKEGNFLSLRHEEDSEIDREKEKLLKEIGEEEKIPNNAPKIIPFLANLIKKEKESANKPKSDRTPPRSNIQITPKLDFKIFSPAAAKKLSPIDKKPQSSARQKRLRRIETMKIRKSATITKNTTSATPLPRASLPSKLLLTPTMSLNNLSPKLTTPQPSRSPTLRFNFT
ncbi:unnamed protein product [Blepharisma stoltei]|uniref:Uncharacterized protein n=1 Tax=Blepharisma stoltei TaxID=1481888 RepID=A0AAU9JPS6_9CILI|nr:unnamed protein product [Blepharisma stoltei]